MEQFEILPGTDIGQAELILPKAIDFIKAVNKSPFAELLAIKRKQNADECIILNVVVELPQKPRNDIKAVERIAVIFDGVDNYKPEVFALRKDFPSVPHINLREKEIPRSLCLYEESYDELKLKWSSYSFLERIREWLRLTAKGKVHASNQALEPLLLTRSAYLIIPPTIFSKSYSEIYSVQKISSPGRDTYFIADAIKGNQGSNYVTTIFATNPQEHGIITRTPRDLKDLHNFLYQSGIDFLTALRERFLLWLNDENHRSYFESNLIILLKLPKYRDKYNHQEELEIRAFLINRSIKEIGVEIGAWAVFNNEVAGILGVPDTTKDGSLISISILNPIDDFNKELAKSVNDVKLCPDVKISVVGLGTIGSQIVNILTRQGIGYWTLIDNDIILPHNLGRHILLREHIGKNKAKVISEELNELLADQSIFSYLAIDIFDNRDPKHQEMLTEFKKSEMILDFSASVPVERYLTLDVDSNARRISCFFTPSGKDLVLIAEDALREHRADMLEMQYYRTIIRNPDLRDHLKFPKNSIRYGYSCRDVSARIPFDLTVQHAAICSTEIKKLVSDKEPRIEIWRIDQEDGVTKFSGQIFNESRINFGEWSLVFDEYLVTKLQSERVEKFPNETGGILLGSYDQQRKIIYVVDSISSPEDSIEWPTVYIRGIKGIKSKVEHIHEITDGMITYLGEWHSHPEGFNSQPSKTDIIAFGWLTQVLEESGHPALMLIVGEDIKYYLGKIVEYK